MDQPVLLIVQFAHAWPQDQLHAGAERFAATFCSRIAGLRWKLFLERPGASGGVYLFEDKASAEKYLASPILDGLRSAPGISEFRTGLHGVMEVPSVMCGVNL